MNKEVVIPEDLFDQVDEPDVDPEDLRWGMAINTQWIVRRYHYKCMTPEDWVRFVERRERRARMIATRASVQT